MKDQYGRLIIFEYLSQTDAICVVCIVCRKKV